MASYVSLLQFTDQGVHNVKDTTKRAEAAKALAAKMGVKITDVLWTFGKYDLILISGAPDDEMMTACTLSLAMLGNVKTQTLRAFRAGEFDGILAKMK